MGLPCLKHGIPNIYLAQTSFCWAFSISTMIRHSLNSFILQLKRKQEPGSDMIIFGNALQYLNSLNFHKRIRIGYKFNKKNFNGNCLIAVLEKVPVKHLIKPIKRNELIMIPVPKPKFFERKVSSGQSEDEYFDDICARQSHSLCDAIDRVSYFYIPLYIAQMRSCSSFIPLQWIQLVF